VASTKSTARKKQKQKEAHLINLTLANNTEKIDSTMSLKDYDENANGFGLIRELQELATENIAAKIKINNVESHLKSEIHKAKEVISKHEKIKLIKESEARRLFEPITEAIKEIQDSLESQNGDIRFRLSDQDAVIEMGNRSGLIISSYGNTGWFRLIEKMEFELPLPYFHESEREIYGYDNVIDYIAKAIAQYIALKESRSF